MSLIFIEVLLQEWNSWEDNSISWQDLPAIPGNYAIWGGRQKDCLVSDLLGWVAEPANKRLSD